MKKITIILILSVVSLSINAQIVNIPDANFKSYLVSNLLINTNNNSEIEVSEANSFSGEISCASYSITNLKGIEYFTSLTKLDCNNNQIDSLDLSTNVLLERLSCASNQLVYLDISNCDSLNHLDCGANNLTSLDVSNNPKLIDLVCYQNDIANLDLSNNVNLLDIYCSANNLQSLDISNCDSIGFLSCPQNQLTSLIIGNKVNLKYLFCRVNNLTSLDVSGAINLERLWCHNNSIDTLVLSNHSQIYSLVCNDNNLSYIDVSSCTSLKDLFTENNNLPTLDLSNNILLEKLNIANNVVANIDLTNNVALNQFSCFGNHVYSLDLSNASNLETLECENNYLTSLNVRNGNNVNMTYFNTVGNPNLECIMVDDSTYSTTNWSNLDAQSYFSDSCYTSVVEAAVYIPDAMLKNNLLNNATINTNNNAEIEVSEALNYIGPINCSYLNIQDMTGIEAFPEITSLNCRGNLISNIDLSQNTKLIYLNCGNNQLSTLDIDSNLILENLFCDSNNLSVFNSENNLLLKKMYCSYNSISNLDFSNNLDLIAINCSNNTLETLNMKNGNNSNIVVFDARSNINLKCVEVDNVDYSTTNWINVDSKTSYKLDCSQIGTSIKSTAENKILVYPNPTKGIVNIETKNISAKIEVFDIMGNKVLVLKQTNEIDLTRLNTGIYFIKINLSTESIIQKIIKN